MQKQHLIRACLFDMGNVLVEFSHQRMCAQIGALVGWSAEAIRRTLIDSGLQEAFERGSLSEAEFHRHFEEKLQQRIDRAELQEAGSAIFRLNEAMPPILDALKGQGYRLVLFSNTTPPHFDYIRRNFSVLERFDQYVLSYQVGALKPEPAMYEAAARAVQCPPQQCFYTDDIPRNIEEARRWGWQAEVFTDSQALIEQLHERGIPLAKQRPSRDR